MKTTERRVSYWAVEGDRWLCVDGVITEALAKAWAADGWRIVTKIITKDVPVYGEVDNADPT